MSTGDSSSEEDTEKLKEATWSFGPAKSNGCQTEHAKNGTQSRRTVAAEHENDGNELQTTPEFRAHVAKKLGAVLDSCISVVSTATLDSSSLLSGEEKEEDENEGFRLFSTSVPGMSSVSAPAHPPKRRPVPSSSDSDSEMEMRLRQAAVTISDIVRPYYTEKTGENKDSGDTQENKADTCESLVTKKKKKKKKKVPKLDEENGNKGQDSPNDVNTQRQDSTQETSQPTQLKKKKKKKVDIIQVNRE